MQKWTEKKQELDELARAVHASNKIRRMDFDFDVNAHSVPGGRHGEAAGFRGPSRLRPSAGGGEPNRSARRLASLQSLSKR